MGPAYVPSPAGVRYSLQLDGLEECEPGVLFKKHTTTRVASHSPINTVGQTGARQVKFLTQGNNNSRSVCWAPTTNCMCQMLIDALLALASAIVNKNN